MNKTTLTYILCLVSILLNAQNKVCSGYILDEQKEPVPYANILLVNLQDSSFVKGVVADDKGVFQIDVDDIRTQILKVSAIGYNNIFTAPKDGAIILEAADYTLENVVIKGNRPVYRMKGDAFITDVGNSLLKDIGSANDVLKQLPGVTGNDGKFKVFGKGAATIYINDRLVRDETELERLSSEDITSVELINNPGSNYDADVRAVLKIKTKRKIEGFAARLRARGSQNHYFSDLEQLNLSYTAKKYHLYGNLYHNGPKSQVDGRSSQLIYTPDTLFDLSMDMMGWKQQSQYYTLESGIGYNIHPQHEIGTSYTYQFSKDIYQGNDFETLLANNKLIDKLSNYSYSNHKYHQHAVNLFYVGTLFNNLKINLNADYINRDVNNNEVITESGLNDNRTVTSLNNSTYDLYATKLVLSYPLWKGSLQGGFDFSHMNYDQEYLNEENYLPQGWFASKEKKFAGFINYSGQFGKLRWEAGVRFEYFGALYYENKNPEPTVDKTYKELYPTLSLSLPIKDLNLSLVYSKRTARPSFYQLRNGIEYTSRFIYSQGNPYLQSSQLHDLSLNAGYRFLQMSLGYYYTKDYMTQSDRLIPGDPVTLIMSHKNVPKFQGISAMLTFQHKIAFWNPTWTAAVYKNFFHLYDYKGNKIDLGHPYGYFTFYNMFTLPKGFILNIDGNCTTAGNDGETYMKAVASLDLGVRKSFFKGALDVNLQVLDVFKSSKRHSISYTEHGEFDRWNYNDSRTIRLSITYKFNKYRKNYKGSNSAVEEMYRM